MNLSLVSLIRSGNCVYSIQGFYSTRRQGKGQLNETDPTRIEFGASSFGPMRAHTERA